MSILRFVLCNQRLSSFAAQTDNGAPQGQNNAYLQTFWKIPAWEHNSKPASVIDIVSADTILSIAISRCDRKEHIFSGTMMSSSMTPCMALGQLKLSLFRLKTSISPVVQKSPLPGTKWKAFKWTQRLICVQADYEDTRLFLERIACWNYCAVKFQEVPMSTFMFLVEEWYPKSLSWIECLLASLSN